MWAGELSKVGQAILRVLEEGLVQGGLPGEEGQGLAGKSQWGSSFFQVRIGRPSQLH